MKKKISIIVPVYNGEKYLSRCLDSILQQRNFNINDLEILAFNDGSKDSSLAILKTYKNNYPGIVKLIDQKNSGTAKTRNMGIDLASGTYVTFVDQDDLIKTDFCSIFYEQMAVTGNDVVQGAFDLVDEDYRSIKTVSPVKTEFGKLLSIPAWSKMYKTEFLQTNNIYFFDNNIGEDNVFTVKIAMLAKRYSTTTYSGYCYLFGNAENVTNTLHKKLSKDINIIRLLEELNTTQSEDVVMRDLLQYNVFRTGMYYLLAYGRNAPRERFNEAYEEVFTWFNQSVPKLFKNQYIWHKPKGESLFVSSGMIIFLILDKLRLVGLFSKVYCKE